MSAMLAAHEAEKDSSIMTQSNSRLFDDLGRLMTDAAGLADGMRREAETVARSQMERMLATMDLAREEDVDEPSVQKRVRDWSPDQAFAERIVMKGEKLADES